MTLKRLMELLEAHYNSQDGEITVQIGDSKGIARPISDISFNEDENILTIF